MFIAATGLVGCGSRPTRLVEAEWASMTKSNLPARANVTEVGRAEGKYCPTTFGSGHHGLMDEALLNAQKNSGADYLQHAVFTLDRKNTCVSVEGTAFKIK